MSVPCNRCNRPLPKWELSGPPAAVCPECGASSIVRVFPALFYGASGPVSAEAAAEGEATCFDHPAKRAVASCSRCGRFVCQLCAVEFHDAVWCPACFTAGEYQAKAPAFENSRTLYDSTALTVALAPLLVWPFTAISAPIALFVAVALLAPAAQPGAALALESAAGRRDRSVRDRLLDLGHRIFCPESEDLKVADNRQIYRKLPGRRRGFIFSASLWTGADHLLSVRNTRFQEQYKRFYFRDIHAIVITRVPRFVVSTPMLVSALLLLITFLVVRLRLPAVTEWLWLLGALLVAGWLFISWKQSCTCRLYTAVSREDLPSLYRIWSARQALAELERHIAQVQGVFTEDWAAAADASSLGPARPADAARNGAAPTDARSRTWISDVFLASLLADAALTAYLIRSPIPLAGRCIGGINPRADRRRHRDLRTKASRHSAHRHAAPGDCHAALHWRHYLCPDDGRCFSGCACR